MKYLFIPFALMMINLSLLSQAKVDSLMRVGIKYHDSFKYDEAIAAYKKALKINPLAYAVHAELAMSYMYSKEYKKSIKHSDIVLEADSADYKLHAYLSKGSCLDYLGKTEESIVLFNEALDRFGEHYLLYFNLGVNYYNIKDYDNAEQTFIKGIDQNPDHASSHLYLGYTMEEKGQRVQSMLSLYYFLLLEPNTERSKTAYYKLKDQYKGNIKEEQVKKKKHVTIYADSNQEDSTFAPADMMLSLLEATGTAIQSDTLFTEEEQFVKNTASFFSVLGELNKEENDGFYWYFYVPFFYQIGESEHNAAYCYYISQCENENARHWLNQNQDALSKFGDWLGGE